MEFIWKQKKDTINLYLLPAGTPVAEKTFGNVKVEIDVGSSGILGFGGKEYSFPSEYPAKLKEILENVTKSSDVFELGDKGIERKAEPFLNIVFSIGDESEMASMEDIPRFRFHFGTGKYPYDKKEAEDTLYYLSRHIGAFQNLGFTEISANISDDEKHGIRALAEFYIAGIARMYSAETQYSSFHHAGWNTGHDEFSYDLSGDFLHDDSKLAELSSWDDGPSVFLGGYEVADFVFGDVEDDDRLAFLEQAFENILLGKGYRLSKFAESKQIPSMLRASLREAIEKALVWKQEAKPTAKFVPVTDFKTADEMFRKGVIVYDDGNMKLCVSKDRLADVIAITPPEVSATIYDADHGMLLTTAGNLIMDSRLDGIDLADLKSELVPLQMGEKRVEKDIPCFPVQKMAKIIFRRNFCRMGREQRIVYPHPWNDDTFSVVDAIGDYPLKMTPWLDVMNLGDNLSAFSQNDIKEILLWEFGGDKIGEENYGLTSMQVLEVLCRNNRFCFDQTESAIAMTRLVMNYKYVIEDDEGIQKLSSGHEKIYCAATKDQYVKLLVNTLTRDPNVSPEEIAYYNRH